MNILALLPNARVGQTATGRKVARMPTHRGAIGTRQSATVTASEFFPS